MLVDRKETYPDSVAVTFLSICSFHGMKQSLVVMSKMVIISCLDFMKMSRPKSRSSYQPPTSLSYWTPL